MLMEISVVFFIILIIRLGEGIQTYRHITVYLLSLSSLYIRNYYLISHSCSWKKQFMWRVVFVYKETKQLQVNKQGIRCTRYSIVVSGINSALFTIFTSLPFCTAYFTTAQFISTTQCTSFFLVTPQL